MTLHLPHFQRAFALLLAVAGVGLALLTWTQVVHTISDAKPVPVTLHAKSIVWGDRVFASSAAMRRWLHARGATYTGWRGQHPVASALLEHRRATPVVAKPAAPPKKAAAAAKKAPTHTAKPAKHAQRTTAKQSPVVTFNSGGSGVQRLFIGLLALLAAVFASAAALPRVICNRFPNAARRIAPYRALLLAGASALMIGIVAGAALN